MLFAPLAACGVGSPAPRPNIIVYLLDTVRADHLSTYGYQRETSPEIDALAEDSVVFTNALAQSSWTKPAVASLLTGRHPISHGVNTWDAVLSPAEELLSEILAGHAYATAAGSTNELISEPFGFAQGFESFVRYGTMDEIASRRLTDGALRWLDARPADRPFFLYLHATDAHAPYTPPRDLIKRLGVVVKRPWLGRTEARTRFASAAGLDPERRMLISRDLQTLYDAEIAHNSLQLGRLIEGLRRRDLYSSSLIVVTSDHGEEFYDHGYLGHGDSLYAEQLRVPLLIKFPHGRGAGRRIADAVRQVDLLPTLLDYLDLPVADTVEGRSLLPLLDAGGVRPESPPVYSFLDDGEGKLFESVILGQYHLIRSPSAADEQDRVELFDLATDPMEKNDLSSRERQATDRLEALLDSRIGRPLAPSVSTQAVDRETLDRLRALGYVGEPGDSESPNENR